MGIWFCTREDVKLALDSKHTARDDAQVDRAIDAGARSTEGRLHRRFAPVVATRFFDWPREGGSGRPWRLWLDADELISVTTLTSGGVAIPASDYFLEPANSGPPFTHVEIDLGSSAAFGGGDTHQRDVAITGLFGYRNDEAAAGVLENAVADAVGTTVDVTDGSLVGVGSVLRCESERMIVTARTALDSGVNLGGDGLTANVADQVVEAAVGQPGEVLLIDAERMLVVDVAGSNRVVKRAWDGSTLAAHSAGADVFTYRRLTVARGQLGTAGAAHADATALSVWQSPSLVHSLNIAEAINTVEQDRAAWGRTVGSGDNEREAGGRGLRDIRAQAYTEHGRKARIRSV